MNIFLWIYFIGCIVAVPILASAIARYDADDLGSGDAVDTAMVAVLVVCCAPLWPVAIPAAWAYAVMRNAQ